MLNTEYVNALILKGDFETASLHFRNISPKEIVEFLYAFMYDNPSLIYYGFFSFLLQKKETAELHYTLAELLVMILNTLPGAYNLAFFHAKRAIALNSNDWSYKEFILLFYQHPCHLMDISEARKIAQEILMFDKNNTQALRVLQGS